MDTKDWLFLLAAVLSPVLAAWLTLFWQNRKQQRDAKERLFLTLMAHRRAFPPTIEWVNALNVIDVVFSEQHQVVELWHRYYEYLHQNSQNDNYQQREHTYLLMLSAMARELGYRRLEQTDIDKFYSPQAHADQAALNYQCQTEWLRVLEGTNSLNMVPKPPTIPGLDDAKP